LLAAGAARAKAKWGIEIDVSVMLGR
jgi:hypothetical protein